MSTSTTLRHLTMLLEIPIYPGAAISTKALHQHVTEQGYSVSKRTVERDLEKLQNLVGLISQKTADGNAWCRLGNNNGKFKEILPTEALMLVLSEKLLIQTMPQSYKKNIEGRLTKAKGILNTGNNLGTWQDKLQVISDGYPLINNSESIDNSIREVIYDSVLKESVVTIRYDSTGKSDSLTYRLNPLGIIVRGQSHYLVATKLTEPEKPKLFLFHRITEAKYEYQALTKPSSFTLKDYFESNPSGWMLREINELVELKVKGFALDVLKHNKLADDQIINTFNEDWSIARFTTIPTYDLVAWILRYGADVICISPEYLTKRIKNTLKETLEQY